MLNKRVIFILFLLIISILALSSVSANDLADDAVGDAASDDMGLAEKTDDLSEDTIEANDLKSEDGSDDVLESSAKGTFTELQNMIDAAPEGGVITLDKDYYVNDDFKDMGYGVGIFKSLTINGNGHILDGQSKSKLFQSYEVKSLVLNNITFQNAYWGNTTSVPGILYLDEFKVSNCQFINNTGTAFGGALTICYVNNTSLVNCTFESNTATTGGGGAVFLQGDGYASFENCAFAYNSAIYGGAIYSCMSEDFYFDSCDFYFNHADNGGDMALEVIENLQVHETHFMLSYSYGKGGSLYLHYITNAQFIGGGFLFNFANYGGSIYCDESKVGFKGILVSTSRAFGYGGVIDSIYSNITLDNSTFLKFWSSTDAGGAVYNVEGNLMVSNSTFVNGSAGKSGGVISNLRSNLTVLSSNFLNNDAYAYGGAIYSMYGDIYINGSFFKDSAAFDGATIYTELPSSSVITNNVFLNSTTSSGSSIAVVSSTVDVIEENNHFEDEYQILLEYVGHMNDEKFSFRSNVLKYVLSNTGTYLGTYDNRNSAGNSSDYLSLDIWDSDYPDNSTIFKNYYDTLKQKYILDKAYYFDDEFKYDEFLNYYVFDSDGDIFVKGEKPGMQNLLQLVNNSSINMARAMINEGSFSDEIILTAEVFSLVNSSLSDIKDIPSYYSSRDYGYVTPVKDQANGGNCWAFSGIATLETCLKKATNITFDFSEENVKNLMAAYSSIGLNMVTNKGGYDSMILSYLTTWSGPIGEDYENYKDSSLVSSYYSTGLPVQNIKFLPQRKSSADNDIYKRAIMDYGAVSITLYWFPVNGHHAISLVGWDDNYNNYDSLGTYTQGAWIFKNSWGTDWGDEGFGYLAYGTKFSSDTHGVLNGYTFVFNKNDNYLKNYQMDYGGVSDYLSSDGPVYYSNKFTSSGSLEYLSAFSTYFKFPTKYVVSVYKGDNLVLTQSGYSEEGYYTIPFNKKIKLDRYEEFTITVENCNSGDNVFPVCQADELNSVNFKAGTSFFSYDGKTWYDLYNLRTYHAFLYGGTKKDTCQVACIKAFTTLYDEPFEVGLEVSRFDNIARNEKVTVNITLTDLGIYNFDAIDKIENSLITLSINDKDYYAIIHDNKASVDVSFEEGGTYTLTAQYKNNLFESNVVKFNFSVNKENAQISATTVTKTYGGTANSVVTLRDDNGNLIKDTVVYFDIDGKSTKIVTNSNGQATMPIGLAPNVYMATVSFEGNGQYNAASTQVKVVVKKATPKITASKKTFKLKTKTKKYTITLKNNLGKVMKSTKVTIKVNGKTYSAKTNSKGKATFKITKLKKIGSFKATITYAGSKYYNKVTKKVTIKVKK